MMVTNHRRLSTIAQKLSPPLLWRSVPLPVPEYFDTTLSREQNQTSPPTQLLAVSFAEIDSIILLWMSTNFHYTWQCPWHSSAATGISGTLTWRSYLFRCPDLQCLPEIHSFILLSIVQPPIPDHHRPLLLHGFVVSIVVNITSGLLG